jgi:2-succinyl-5-enolpyruvyl-6-hydroxy-3-cyclohexene-1-carboxylate synthase
MKTTFEHISNIINKKESYLLTEGEEFVPYMIQRWISMISPEMAYVVNETSNSISPAMQSKQMWHDYFLTVIPKIGYKKIEYIKKPKSAPSKDVSELARKLEISFREAQEIIELDASLLKKEKTVEVLKKKSK